MHYLHSSHYYINTLNSWLNKLILIRFLEKKKSFSHFFIVYHNKTHFNLPNSIIYLFLIYFRNLEKHYFGGIVANDANYEILHLCAFYNCLQLYKLFL